MINWPNCNAVIKRKKEKKVKTSRVRHQSYRSIMMGVNLDACSLASAHINVIKIIALKKELPAITYLY